MGLKRTHKADPTWGETLCWLERFVLGREPLRTSARWCDVTCKRCLKLKGKR